MCTTLGKCGIILIAHQVGKPEQLTENRCGRRCFTDSVTGLNESTRLPACYVHWTNLKGVYYWLKN